MGHTYSNLLIHVIFSTKDRRPIIRADFSQRLHKYLGGLARQEFGKAIKVGGTEDHIHGLISTRTDVALAQAMSRWKSLSTGWIHKTIAGAADFAWQGGYGAFSVSQSNAVAVIAYIEKQAEHHARQTFAEEFIELLQRHQVEFDPNHVWD
jgi:REP element-mobilizing transposase RayT